MSMKEDELREKIIELAFPGGLVDGTASNIMRVTRKAQEKHIDKWVQLITERDAAIRIDAHAEGYRRGVHDFSGYYMDASIPAQRQLILPDIARELIDGYKPPVYVPKGMKF